MYNDKNFNDIFHVTKLSCSPIIGLALAEQLGFIDIFKEINESETTWESTLKETLEFSEKLQSELDGQIALLDETVAMSFSDKKLDEFKTETQNDVVLNVLKDHYFKGWPATIKMCNIHAKPFFKVKHAISVRNGLLFGLNVRLRMG